MDSEHYCARCEEENLYFTLLINTNQRISKSI